MPTRCHITGILYDSNGLIVKKGKISARLQQDIISVDGDKIVPVTTSQTLSAMLPPLGVSATPVHPTLDAPSNLNVTATGYNSSNPHSTMYYTVSAVGTYGDVSPESDIFSVEQNALGGGITNDLTWNSVVGAVAYHIYGRTSAYSSRVLIGTSTTTSYSDDGTTDGTPEADDQHLTTYYYEVSAVDGAGQETTTSTTVSCQNITLDAQHYNVISWTPDESVASFNIYGRDADSLTRVLLGSSSGNTYTDNGTTVGTPKPTTNTSGGYISLYLVPTVGATPAGVAYFVEYDPDPEDTSRPARSKPGYWSNFWSVPNAPSESIGNFAPALRGEATYNFMPLGGTIANLADTVTWGSGSNTTKRLVANNAGSPDPEIRYVDATGAWELSHDGSTFDQIATLSDVMTGGGGGGGGTITGVTAGSGLGGGGTSGTVTLFVRNLTNSHISSTAAISWSKLQSGYIPTSRLPYDNSTIILNGSNLLSVNPSALWSPGDICMTGRSTPTPGFLMCDGSLYNRVAYVNLFNAIGTTYGATDSTNFRVPDLRGCFPLGKAAAGTGSVLGQTGGSLDHTHTTPNHSHHINAHSHTGPAHRHGIPTGGAHNHTLSTTIPQDPSFHDVAAGGDFTMPSPSHYHNASTSTDGNHNHGGLTDWDGDQATSAVALDTWTDGGGTTSAANPPFCVVNFQIKY